MRQKRGLIVLFTLITAIIHLFVGLPVFPLGLDTLLFLNGLGYLVLLGLWSRPPASLSKGLIRGVFIAYTAITVIGYFAMWGADGLRDPLGMFTKVVEVLLIALLATSKE